MNGSCACFFFGGIRNGHWLEYNTNLAQDNVNGSYQHASYVLGCSRLKTDFQQHDESSSKVLVLILPENGKSTQICAQMFFYPGATDFGHS